MSQFHNPIAPKVKKKEKQSPWDYRAPPYDERTSCYMDAGSHYGVGYTNPVGHDGVVKQRVPTLPYGKHLGPQVSEAPREHLKQEFIR